MKLPKVSQPSTGGSGDTQPEISTLKVMDIAAGRDHTMLLGKVAMSTVLTLEVTILLCSL